MIKREDVLLRPLTESDLEDVLQWRNSEHVRKYMFTDHRISYEEHLKWYNKNKDNNHTRHFIFEYQGCACGVVNFTNLDFQNKRGFLGIYIGKTDLTNGLGSASLYLALEDYFETLHFYKMCVEVFSFNEKAIHLYKKFGFAQEGYFKNHVLKNGRYEDVLFYALFSDQWFENKSLLYKKIFR